MKIVLKVEEGPGKGKSFEFSQHDVFIVGRASDAHLSVGSDDTSVSRRHCLLEVAPPRCFIRDLGSTNGTFLNGQQITQQEIRHGDRVEIGRTILRINLLDDAPSASFCGVCGKPLALNPGQPLWLVAENSLLCPDCRNDGFLPVATPSASNNDNAQVCCSTCSVDLSSKANQDGQAGTLKDQAPYACPACADKRFRLIKPRTCGNFRLLRQLGAGGMGTVFLSWDPVTCRLGALKKISLPFPDEITVRRFLRETRIMASMLHPNIVRLFQQGIHKGSPFLVSEFLEGGTVAEKLKALGKPIAPTQACQWACQVLEGLGHFHASGHVHRDIKPANILLQKRGTPDSPETAKLTDFGLAKCFSAVGGTALTKPNTMGGSLQYTAPEQILSFRTAGPLADIYSLGISLYQLVTGALPFAKAMKAPSSQRDILLIVLEEPVSPVRELNPEIPEALATIIDQAIQKDPADRFQGAKKFQNALKAFLVSLNIASQGPSASGPSQP